LLRDGLTWRRFDGRTTLRRAVQNRPPLGARYANPVPIARLAAASQAAERGKPAFRPLLPAFGKFVLRRQPCPHHPTAGAIHSSHTRVAWCYSTQPHGRCWVRTPQKARRRTWPGGYDRRPVRHKPPRSRQRRRCLDARRQGRFISHSETIHIVRTLRYHAPHSGWPTPCQLPT
jgi:hypothetical protein